ncbi:MAG: glycosyltransferase family 4 protein [Candidatus Aminicenantia bacterium]
MKILVITPTFFPIMGGAEKGIYELYSKLSDRHEIKILTPVLSKKLVENFGVEEVISLKRIEVINYKDTINFLRLPGQFKLKGLIPPFSITTVFAAFKALKSFNPDAVNVFYAIPSGLAGVFIEKVKKKPVVLSLIGRDVPGPGIPPFWKHYVRFISKKVRKTIFISEYCRKSLGFSSDFGEVIPFGVDTKKFGPDLDASMLRKRLNIPETSYVLFSVQRLDHWKRVDVLIRAMKMISTNMDAYLIIGGKGPEMENLKKLSEKLSVSSRVIFTGYINEEELPFYFSVSDLFVFHTTYETLGIVILQAMASGKPLVSVKCTAIPEVIEDGLNGILVEPLDPNALANGVIEILRDKEKLEKFSRTSVEIALRKYDLELLAEKYEKVFYDLKT